MKFTDEEQQIIVDYMAETVSDETVEHLEKVASERVLGRRVDVWDVHTTARRWWVMTAPINLYSQEQFPSLEVALSFHVGLTARVMERDSKTAPGMESARFPGAWRKWEQAGDALSEAEEAEDFQSVGMRCRECLITFGHEASNVVQQDDEASLPKNSDFKGWTELIANTIAAGESAALRRTYLKSIAKSTWDLANWLTHASNAVRFDADCVFDATGHLLSSWSLAMLRFELKIPDRCPNCCSYKVATLVKREGSGELTQHTVCERCGWHSDPTVLEEYETSDGDSKQHPDTDPQDLGPCVLVDVPLRGPPPPKPSTSIHGRQSKVTNTPSTNHPTKQNGVDDAASIQDGLAGTEGHQSDDREQSRLI